MVTIPIMPPCRRLSPLRSISMVHGKIAGNRLNMTPTAAVERLSVVRFRPQNFPRSNPLGRKTARRRVGTDPRFQLSEMPTIRPLIATTSPGFPSWPWLFGVVSSVTDLHPRPKGARPTSVSAHNGLGASTLALLPDFSRWPLLRPLF